MFPHQKEKVLDSKDKGVGSKIYSFKNYSTADCIKYFGTRKVLKLLWAVQREQKQYRFVILSQRSKQTFTNFFSIEKRSKMVFGTARAAVKGR
jgi:hypothetical protein